MPPDPNNKRKIETKLTVSVVSERIDGLLFELGILLTHVEWNLFYFTGCAGSANVILNGNIFFV
jgi:hypothetical protein